MNKWQYHTEVIKRGQTDEKLNDLGRAGWECFSIVEGIGSSMIYTFKKPSEGALLMPETSFGIGEEPVAPIVRRGRPKGSKNKPKNPQAKQEPLTEQMAK